MTEWDLDKAKQFLNNLEMNDLAELPSLAWWLVRRLDALEKQNNIFYNNLSRSVQRRLDAQGVSFDAKKGKITNNEEGRDIPKSRRIGRRSGHDRGGHLSPFPDD